ncbi:MAG: VWA domain-containing protein, partial [Peptococcaceae bacterium]|nr:VWA domain-containing protein [Peptococcaceae bacterium]
MSTLVEKSSQWGLGTNLHASLDTFLEKHHRLLSPSVFVIIVSDAQTIQAYQTTAGLKEIRSRVKDIIWLNTMPREDWLWALEINEFQKYCRMFECSTLDQLSNVLGSQVLTV